VIMPGTGTSLVNPRIQSNGASPYIDAQTIYGENNALAAFVRLGTQGLLKFQPGPDGEFPTLWGNTSQLPSGVTPANNANNVPTSTLFALGSPRVNQQPQSMCLCILWRREHNRLARLLGPANPSWDDETIFQEARRRVIAYMQHFYETEYVPMLLGLPNLDAYGGYDDTIDVAVDAMFNEVTLRYGHTQVNNVTWRLNNDGTHATGGDILLRDVFFDPTILYTGGCSPIYYGLQAKQHNSPEANIVEDLKEYVFAKKGFLGIDLLSTNMRRAREMGLPNFGTARQIYGEGLNWPAYSNFNFTDWPDQFDTAYNTSDPFGCDPWICGIMENTLPVPNAVGGELGQLFHYIFKRQFTKFRAGDRFWYTNSQFDSSDLAEIQSTTLAQIVLRNSVVAQMYCNIFEGPYGSYTGTTGPLCYNTVSATSSTTFANTATTGAASTAVVSFAVLALSMLIAMLF